jgi:N-acetylmuramoyl-L-alanine amidase
MGAVLEGGDKAKTEIVRAVAREVRAYLEELGLREVMTDYSLEVRASFNLRKLTDLEKGPPIPEPTANERTRGT